MAYVGTTERLCEAIINNDVDYVRSWAQQEGVEVNVRDYCGRTPLHLACLSTSTDIEIVECLINNNARLVARLQDGRTALHLAAARGRTDMVDALMRRSEKNAAEKAEREAAKGAQKRKSGEAGHLSLDDSGDVEMADVGASSNVAEPSQNDDDSATEPDEDLNDFESIHMSDAGSMVQAPSVTSNNFIKIEKLEEGEEKVKEGPTDEDLDAEGEDDIYDVNVEDWE